MEDNLDFTANFLSGRSEQKKKILTYYEKTLTWLSEMYMTWYFWG